MLRAKCLTLSLTLKSKLFVFKCWDYYVDPGDNAQKNTLRNGPMVIHICPMWLVKNIKITYPYGSKTSLKLTNPTTPTVRSKKRHTYYDKNCEYIYFVYDSSISS